MTSHDKAKRLFKIKTEGLAGFCSGAGLMHPETTASEQEKLRREMFHCQQPLVLRDMLREIMDIPSPPPVSAGPPPPEVMARLDRHADPPAKE